jgi:hypothetical protein
MEFSLLHAGLAAGATLAAIPVILHLFMKQTPKHVIFPALRLIRERQKRSRKKLRVKNWLLLLARMAVLALMALALARPALHSQANLGDREVPTALALVFDTSLSMQYTEKNETRLAEAKQRADEILKKTTDSSQVFVIDSAEPGAPPPMSPAAAKKRIDGLTLRDANRSLNSALGQAYRAVADSDRPRREVYVLTDLAASSWEPGRPVDGLDAARKVKMGVATYVLRLTPKEVRDVAVVEALPASGVATQGEPIEIKAKLRSSGPARSRVVEFLIDKAKRDQKTVEIPADGEAEATFKTPTLAVGLHQGEVRVAGTDPMEFDDHRYFTLQVKPAMRVLVVSDKADDAEFLVQALDPEKLRNTASRIFRVDRVLSPQLSARMRDSLKEYTCVFLLNVHKLADPEWSRLNAYVREGGGLVIAPGELAEAENYNSRIAAQVVPAALGKHVRAAEPMAFGKADFAHPLFRRYARDLDADLSDIPVYRYWSITPAKDGARTLLSYQDNAPALIERTFAGSKTGRVMLWTTPLSRVADQEDRAAWNELPSRGWSFVYLMFETVPYLAGTAGENLNYEAGQDVILPIDPTRRFSSYTVQGPGNPTPERHSPPISTPQLVIAAPQKVGQWTFSVNPPESETRVKALATRDLDALFGKDKYALADDTESLKRVVAQGRVGRELFPWIMALILALVTAENFLANRFYRERVARTS